MRKWLAWCGGVAVSVLLVATVLFLAARAQGRSPQRLALVEMMEAAPGLEGRNAFPAIWLLGYEVPADRVESLAAADVARFTAGSRVDGQAPQPSFVSEAEGRFPGLFADAGAVDALCPSDRSCLVHVREDAGRYDAMARELAAAHANTIALRSYDHYLNGFPPRPDMPFPPLGQVPRAALTHAAVRFAQGMRVEGLDDACEVAAAWRPFVAGSDSLVISMVSERMFRAASGLVAEMLSEMPRGSRVPSSCRTAFRTASPGEGSLCLPMKGEFAYATQALEDPALFAADGGWRAPASLVFDPRASKARMAAYMSIACSGPGRARVSEDRPFEAATLSPPRGMGFECLANLGGCLLTGIAAPAYDLYYRRGQDHLMRVRMMGTLLWLRDQADDGRPLEALLESRPEALRSPGRRIEVRADGRALETTMYAQRDDASPTWAVPLRR